jgi:hypothetical protein
VVAEQGGWGGAAAAARGGKGALELLSAPIEYEELSWGIGRKSTCMLAAIEYRKSQALPVRLL